MTTTTILLKPAEAARILRISVSTLERWRRTGRGPAYLCLSNRMFRYRQEDVKEWADGQSLLGEEDAQ